MSRNKQLVHIPDGALEQLRNERMMKIQAYLDELGKSVAIEQSAFDLVLRCELEHIRLPTEPAAQAELVARCQSMAAQVARAKLRLLHAGVKEIMREQNVADVPEHIVWSARRSGVELLDAPEPTTTNEAH